MLKKSTFIYLSLVLLLLQKSSSVESLPTKENLESAVLKYINVLETSLAKGFDPRLKKLEKATLSVLKKKIEELKSQEATQKPSYWHIREGRR